MSRLEELQKPPNYYLQTPGFKSLTSPNRKHAAVVANESKRPADICSLTLDLETKSSGCPFALPWLAIHLISVCEVKFLLWLYILRAAAQTPEAKLKEDSSGWLSNRKKAKGLAR